MSQIFTLLTLALQLLTIASGSNVPEMLRLQAISTANIAIAFATKTLQTTIVKPEPVILKPIELTPVTATSNPAGDLVVLPIKVPILRITSSQSDSRTNYGRQLLVDLVFSNTSDKLIWIEHIEFEKIFPENNALTTAMLKLQNEGFTKTYATTTFPNPLSSFSSHKMVSLPANQSTTLRLIIENVTDFQSKHASFLISQVLIDENVPIKFDSFNRIIDWRW